MYAFLVYFYVINYHFLGYFYMFLHKNLNNSNRFTPMLSFCVKCMAQFGLSPSGKCIVNVGFQ